MWIIEFLTMFFLLGVFTLVILFIGVIQLIQMIFGFFVFILYAPFAMVGALIGLRRNG